MSEHGLFGIGKHGVGRVSTEYLEWCEQAVPPRMASMEYLT